MTLPVGTRIVRPIGACSASEAVMPFKPRKKPEPLDEPALYQYAVGALGRQMRTVTELKRLMSRRVEAGETGEVKIAAVVARLLDQRYLDDPAFASTYTRLRQENQASANAGHSRSSREKAFKRTWSPQHWRPPTSR